MSFGLSYYEIGTWECFRQLAALLGMERLSNHFVKIEGTTLKLLKWCALSECTYENITMSRPKYSTKRLPMNKTNFITFSILGISRNKYKLFCIVRPTIELIYFRKLHFWSPVDYVITVELKFQIHTTDSSAAFPTVKLLSNGHIPKPKTVQVSSYVTCSTRCLFISQLSFCHFPLLRRRAYDICSYDKRADRKR